MTRPRLKQSILAFAIALPLLAIATLKLELPQQWLAKKGGIPDLAPDVPDSEHWLVDKVTSGDTLIVGIDDSVIPLKTKHEDHTLAELFLQPDDNPEVEISINSEMLMAGMALVYSEHVDKCPNGEVLKRAQAIGKNAKAGIWANDNQHP